MSKKASQLLRPGSDWQKDDDVEACTGCNLKFSLRNRKHHCRFCGMIYCDKCAPTRQLPLGTPCHEQNYSQARRCNWCQLPRCFLANRHTSQSQLDATPAEIIFSYLDGKAINNFQQTYTGTLYRFHCANVPYFGKLQDRFPTLMDRAQTGKGGFGTVFTVEDRSRQAQKVAVKVVEKRKIYNFAAWKKLYAEAAIMHDNDHPNVVRLLDLFQTPTQLVMVMELGDGGSLKKAYETIRKGNLSMEVFTSHVVSQVSAGLHHLHTRNIAHRDIKHDNIVLSRDFSRVMIIDFGLAETMEDDNGTYFPCGTMGFASPENIKAVVEHKGRFKATRKMLFASDFFNVGVIAFSMLSARRPLKGTKFQEQWKEVVKGIRCNGPHWDRISLPAKEIVEHLLHSSHEQRANNNDVQQSTFVVENEPKFRVVEEHRRKMLATEDELEEQEFVYFGAESEEWRMLYDNALEFKGSTVRSDSPDMSKKGGNKAEKKENGDNVSAPTSPTAPSPTTPTDPSPPTASGTDLEVTL